MKVGTFIAIENSQWKEKYQSLFKYGFDFFELMPENLSAFTIPELKKYFKNKEIIIHAPFIEPNIITSSEIIRAAAKKYYLNNLIPLVKAFHPKVVTIHLGKRHKLYETVVYKEFIELAKIIPQITFENMAGNISFWDESYPNSEEEIDKIHKITNCPLTFDVGHWLRQKYNIYKLLEKYLPFIKNIHIHDTVNGKDHQTIGTGILDLERFMNILKKNNYQGYISIELVPDNITGAISSFKRIKELI